MGNIRSFRELRVWNTAMDLAMKIFEASKRFPLEEKYSLTDQIRRSSRSVAANITEAWRRRKHSGAFRNQLNVAESEAAETQTWIELALRCGYLNSTDASTLDSDYETLISQLVFMSTHAEDWVIKVQVAETVGRKVASKPQRSTVPVSPRPRVPA